MKNLILVCLILLTSLAKSQLNVEVKGAIGFVECGLPDTIIVKVNNVSASVAKNISIDIPFQANMILVDSISNVVFIDTSNTNNPILGFQSDSILPGQSDSIIILVKALCGYVTGGPVNITANIVSSVGAASDIYNGFSAYSPDVTLTEIGGSFNLVDRIDTMQREWVFNQIQPNSYLLNAYIQNDYFRLRIIDIEYDSMGIFTELDTSYYTNAGGKLFIHLDSTIFKYYGNQDYKLDNGEPVRIRTKFRSTFCAPTSEVASGFSCDSITDKSMFCETSTAVFTSININQQNNASYSIQSILDSTSPGSTCNDRILRLRYVNRTTETFPGSGALFDLKARLLVPRIQNQISEQIKVIIDGYEIDSVEYEPITGTAAYPIATLGPRITSQIPGSKLTDLDGDGEFDDLAAGDTITMTFVIKKHRVSTLAEGYGGTQTTPILFIKGCNTSNSAGAIGTTFYVGQEGMHIRSANLINKVQPTLNIGDSTFYRVNTIRFYGAASTNCGDSVEFKTRIRLTEGVDIVPGSYINASGASGNHLANVITQVDSVTWDLTFKYPDPYRNGAFGFNRSLGRYHQTNINIRLSPSCNFYTQNDVCDALTGVTMNFLNVLYQCETACGGGIDRDSVGGVSVLSPNGIMTVSDTNNLCAFAPGVSNSITTDFVDIYRTTYGYADETYTTPLVPNTTDSVQFLSGDSLVFKINGVVRGGAFDSVRIVVDVPNLSGNTNRYFVIDWLATNINVKESSTSLTRYCNILDATYSFANSQNTYTFTFPLGCLSLDGIGSLEIGDSIFFEAIGRLPKLPSGTSNPGFSNGFLSANFSYANGGGSFSDCNSLSHFISSVGYRYLYRINEAGYRSNGSCSGLFLEYRLVNPAYYQRDYRPFYDLDSVTLDMDNAGNTFVIDTTRPIMYYDRFADNFIPLPSNAVNIINNRKARLYNLGDTTLNPQDANHSNPVTGNFKFNVMVPFDVNCNFFVGNNYTYNRFTLHGDEYAYSNYLNNTTSYSTLIYRAAGGPAFINSNDNISYLFNSIQSSVVINNVTDTFSFSIQNTSHLGATPTIGASFPYVFIDDPNGYMSIVGATDISSTSYNVRTIPGIGHILELDTFGLNELKTIDLVFQPTTCGAQSFDFTPAWACGGYPTDSNLLGCGNIQTRTFSFTPVPSNVSIQLVNDNVSPNICDTLIYGVLFTNPSGGAADSLSFVYFSPDTLNINVLSANVDFEGNTYTVTHTFTPPNRYAFDLKNQVFDSVATLGFDPGDSLLFNLNIEPLCGIYVGLNNAFTTEGTQACGGAIPVPAVLSSSPMNFNGSTPVYSSNISMSGTGTLNSCGSTNYNIKWYNIGGAPGFNNTQTNDSIWLILPAGMSYVSGSFMGIYNAPFNSTPNISVKPSGTYYSWGLNAGIVTGDSIEFNVGLTTFVSDTCGSTYEVEIESVRVFSLDCDGTNCPTPILSGADTTVLTNDKAVLSLLGIGGVQNGCNDSISVNIGIVNTGLPISAGNNTTVYFLADSNNNGVYDGTDVLLTSYNTTDSILTNDTLNITYTFYPTSYTGEVCNIIAFLDTSSCVCSGDTSVLIPISLNHNLNDTVVCEGDSVNLNVCAGTGYYSSRIFDWEGATTYLSDSTILSPVFRSPSNIANDTVFTFVLHTDRDSCSATDTISILVLASPSGTLPDTMICLGDSATLRSIPGVYFEVWNAAIGGTLLDTTEFKVAPLVTTTYYLTAIDSTGGCSSLIRDSVTVYIDTVLPIIMCNDTTIYVNGSGQIIIDTSYVLAGASDNCGIQNIWTNDTLFDCNSISTLQTVTIYIMDNNGNIDSCTANVTVGDSTAPTISCQDTTIYLNTSGQFQISANYISGVITDNCGVQNIWTNDTLYDCSNIGSNTATLYATDIYGNIDSCTATVTVLDTLNPIVTCNDTTVYLDASGQVIIDTSFVFINATDNCGIDSVWANDTLFTCVNTGINTATVYARDVNGNIDSCLATVTVLDTISPTVVCNDTAIYLPLSGSIIIDTSYILTSANDNCIVDSIWTNDTLYNCSNIGVSQAVIYVRDASGNISSCIANVTVIDTVAPQIVCRDTTIYLNNLGQGSIDTSFVLANINENCALDTAWIDNTIFTCLDSGQNTVTVYVRDAQGNTDSCQSTVTVLDSIPPIPVCTNFTIYLDTNGQASITVGDIDGGSTDNCAIVSTTININTFDCSLIGVNMVTLTVTDDYGNQSACIAQVTVLDTVTPLISCGTTLYDTVSSLCEYTVPDFTGLSILRDNCTDSINLQITQTPSPGTVITVQDQFTQNIVILVVDSMGNQSVCMFDVSLICKDEFQIPEFISPNGDGKNDTWIITGIEDHPNNAVKIFNRYGALVYETRGYQNTWDGTANVAYIFQAGLSDNILPSGTYFFRLELDTQNQNSDVYTGIIQIHK